MSAYLYFVQCAVFYVLFHFFNTNVVIHKRGFKNPLAGRICGLMNSVSDVSLFSPPCFFLPCSPTHLLSVMQFPVEMVDIHPFKTMMQSKSKEEEKLLGCV